MYLPFKKQGLKALKCIMKDFHRYCSVLLPNRTITHAKHSSLAPAEALELPPAACAHCKVRKIYFGCGTGERAAGGVRIHQPQEMGAIPSREDLLVVALPFLAPQTAPALRFGSNTPLCSPAPQKSLTPKTKRLIMEIMQIRRELQITSSSAASVSVAWAASSQGILHPGDV